MAIREPVSDKSPAIHIDANRSSLAGYSAVYGGLWDYNIEKDALFCDERWFAIVGLNPATTPIRSLRDFKPFIHPDDVFRATTFDLNEVTRLIANDQQYHVEFRVIRPDNAVRFLRSVACLIYDASGDMRAVGCLTDVTETAQGASDRKTSAGPRADAELPATPVHPTQDSSAELSLSQKERECLSWVSVGKTAWETAQILGRSQRTIEFHLNNAIRKLGATNKIHAVCTAIRAGLL